jgi:hypothetical protein
LPSPSDGSLAGFTLVLVTNYSNLGDAVNEPMKSVVFTFGDSLTWVKGAHVFKMGGEIMRLSAAVMCWSNLTT